MPTPDKDKLAFLGHGAAPNLARQEALAGTARPGISSSIRELSAYMRPRPSIPIDTAAAGLPRGDGHAVLVLPALLADDAQTADLRAYLASIGYSAHGWGLGPNAGPTERLVAGATARLASLAAAHGKVSLVGFSMGGMFARWLARRTPGSVRQVITVGSPFMDASRSTVVPMGVFVNLWPGSDVRGMVEDVGKPLTVPSTSVFSQDDGIVDWRSCRDPSASADTNVEVEGTHVNMTANPAVLRVLALRLARTVTGDGRAYAPPPPALPRSAPGMPGLGTGLASRWGR